MNEELQKRIDSLKKDDIIFLEKHEYRQLCSVISQVHPKDITSKTAPHYNTVYTDDYLVKYAVKSDGQIVVTERIPLPTKYEEVIHNDNDIGEDARTYLEEQGYGAENGGMLLGVSENGVSTKSGIGLADEKSNSGFRENDTNAGGDSLYSGIKKSLRQKSTRQILASLDESQIDTSTQKGKNMAKALEEYREVLRRLEEQQDILDDVNHELYKIYKMVKGQKRDTSREPELRVKKVQTQNRSM